MSSRERLPKCGSPLPTPFPVSVCGPLRNEFKDFHVIPADFACGYPLLPHVEPDAALPDGGVPPPSVAPPAGPHPRDALCHHAHTRHRTRRGQGVCWGGSTRPEFDRPKSSLDDGMKVPPRLFPFFLCAAAIACWFTKKPNVLFTLSPWPCSRRRCARTRWRSRSSCWSRTCFGSCRASRGDTSRSRLQTLPQVQRKITWCRIQE
jgi:hypothetical protein